MEFHHLDLTTETYLVHDPDHLRREERIGRATFDAIEGVDLFVQNLVPQLYDLGTSRDERGRIEQFLRQHAFRLTVDSTDKRFIRSYIMGYLRQNEVQMSTAIYEWFAPLEMYLRDNYQQFVNRLTADTSALSQIEEDAQKRLAWRTERRAEKHTLPFFLEVCILAMTRFSHETSGVVSQLNVREFTDVRNKAAHLETRQFLTRWEDPLKVRLPAI